jgi:SAM-dependent methyltransferase
VIDIGAGTGRWALFMARHAGQVTAVEPSESMIAVMRENIAEAGLDNIEIVQGAWPEADVAVHDYALCSHAMYGVADLSRFIERMNEVTRRTCFMLMRVPVLNGVMNVAAERVWGQPHDSPNFVIAYNVLLEMGIHANVLMEDTGAWGGWRHDTIDAALAGMKEKLGLQGPSPHDTFLRALLHERLSYDEEEDQWVWPPSVRSALVYWDVEQMD